MHVFINPPEDDKQIKTVILLILLALFPVVVQMDSHTLTVYTQQKVKVKLSLCLTN
jgi:hypothetical protein